MYIFISYEKINKLCSFDVVLFFCFACCVSNIYTHKIICSQVYYVTLCGAACDSKHSEFIFVQSFILYRTDHLYFLLGQKPPRQLVVWKL